MTRPLPFVLVAAFSKGPFEGNPAAVVFIDDELETEMLMKIGSNFNQPITSVVGRQISSDDQKVAAFNIRWFSPSMEEVPVCGHGTMAAARAVFERGLVPNSVEIIEFHTLTKGVMRARKADQGRIEIRLPASTVEDVSSDERSKMATVVAKACGRDVGIKYIGKGSKGFENYLMVELDEQENLGECKMNVGAWLETGYSVNVVTTAASKGDHQFVSRMFAPAVLPGVFAEDAVCGTAHCLTGPYWFKKNGLQENQEFTARQVSSRGGTIGLLWDQSASLMCLKGETYVMASGEIYV
ncbi:hypothetical protein B0H10DRAFT_2192905 [Mycena sp. CBHHK59/15]|nr:hypothetical protein B0H10DRAFT_2192905 [Mycena sp. CBHHK59/15]